jgi:hypothetical protein
MTHLGLRGENFAAVQIAAALNRVLMFGPAVPERNETLELTRDRRTADFIAAPGDEHPN